MTKRFLFALLFTVMTVFAQTVPRLPENTPFSFEWTGSLENVDVRVYTLNTTTSVLTPFAAIPASAISSNTVSGVPTFTAAYAPGVNAGNYSFVMTRVKDGIESDYSNIAPAQFRPSKGSNFRVK
jgi:hypothetical protein